MEKSFTIMLLEDEGYKPVAMVKVKDSDNFHSSRIYLFCCCAEGPWLQAPSDYGVTCTPFVSQCRQLGAGDLIVSEYNTAVIVQEDGFLKIRDWKYFLAKMEDSIEDGITTYRKMKEKYSHV